MIEPLSPNTQAILLLSAPLVAGRSQGSGNLLSLAEYNQLARILRENQKQPADLIGPNANALIDLYPEPLGGDRLRELLGRGFLLAQAVDRWNTRMIWVLSRADARYPKRWKGRLRENAPPLLYGCGNSGILERAGLTVVGSSQASDKLIRYAEEVGKLSAEARRAVITEEGEGISQALKQSCLRAGGEAITILADNLEQAALNRTNRGPLKSGRLVLISPNDPSATFPAETGQLDYALSEAALVITSDFEKGATWNGVTEQLDRLQYVPIFAINDESKGNTALLRRGARPWPEPQTGQELNDVIATALDTPYEMNQESFAMPLREKAGKGRRT